MSQALCFCAMLLAVGPAAYCWLNRTVPGNSTSYTKNDVNVGQYLLNSYSDYIILSIFVEFMHCTYAHSIYMV